MLLRKIKFFFDMSLINFYFYRYRDPCSASINEDDLHTTKLVGNTNKGVGNYIIHFKEDFFSQ